MFSTRFHDLALAFQSCIYSKNKELILEEQALREAFRLIADTRERSGIVYVIGNGGSAGLASHFSNDLMKALKIPSQCLYDSNLLTCLANDFGYENVFSYPLDLMLKKEDLLVAISSSGKSPNILKAAEGALGRGASLITLSGFSEMNPLRKLGQLNFWVDRCDYGLVETAHFFILHTIVDLWSKCLSPVGEHDQITRSCNK